MLKAISKEEKWMPFLTVQKFRFSIILLLLFLFYGTAIQAKDKEMINVLLFSGRNNHQWQKYLASRPGILGGNP
jgi:hypothetical protein